MVLTPPRSLLALALSCALALLAGCGSISSRNDPDERGALVIGADLLFVDASAYASAEGRLWLRVLPERGPALERELDWTLARTSLEAAARPRSVEFRHDRGGVPPSIALFDDLPPGTYRVSSFLVSARLEKRDGTTTLASLAGDLRALGGVTVASGELVDLGLLTISLSPTGRYDYKAARDGRDRAAPVQSARGELTAFRAIERPIGASGASNASPEAVMRERARPRGMVGEPRRDADGPAPVTPETGAPTEQEMLAAYAADRSAAALGLSLIVGEVFQDAEACSGVLRVELHRVGRGSDIVAFEAGFELGAIAPGTPTASAAPARRAAALVASGAAPSGAGIVTTTRLEAGEWEVGLVRINGTLTRAGAERAITAEAKALRFHSVRIATGELADLGALTLELAARDRLTLRYDPAGAEERLALVRAAGARGPGTRPDPILAGLRPVLRPIAAEDHR